MPPRQLLLLLALCLGASSALRRIPEEEVVPPSHLSDVSFSTDEDQEDLPDFGDGPDEPELVREFDTEHVQVRDTPFKNVLLVVHCRLNDVKVSRIFGKPTSSAELCNKRKPLFRNLKQFFPEIVWWNAQDDCGTGDAASPHYCIAEQLLDRAKYRDGIFYMHFDALVRPEVLKRGFDLRAIGVFNNHEHCDMNTGCGWGPWGNWHDGLLHAVFASAAMGFPVETRKFWLGMDDLFYMPKAIFPRYKELVGAWDRIHHEVAGPTMWRILSHNTSVNIVSLGCTGGCCKEVQGSEALMPGFRCGHPFRLNNADTRAAFTKAQLMN